MIRYIRYEDNLHNFIELLMQKVGIAPNFHKHHVLVPCGKRMGFAFFHEETRQWLTYGVYDSISVEELSEMSQAVQDAIGQYEEDHREELLPIEIAIPVSSIGERFRTGEALSIIRSDSGAEYAEGNIDADSEEG